MQIPTSADVRNGAFCRWTCERCCKCTSARSHRDQNQTPPVRTRRTEVQQSYAVTHSNSGDTTNPPQRCHLLWACSKGWQWWKAKQGPRASLWTPPRGRQSTALSASRRKCEIEAGQPPSCSWLLWQKVPLKMLQGTNLSAFLNKRPVQTAPVGPY